MGVMAYNTPLSERRIAQIQHLLRRQDMTAHEIADGIFMTKRWAQDYLSYLHREKKIHISEWRRMIRSNGGPIAIAVYCWGYAQDATRPTPLTKAEITRRYRNHPEHADERRERDKMIKRAKRMTPHRDWTAAWIPVRKPEGEPHETT